MCPIKFSTAQLEAWMWLILKFIKTKATLFWGKSYALLGILCPYVVDVNYGQMILTVCVSVWLHAHTFILNMYAFDF